ncbi:MAG: hypothetical protein U0Q22_10095 [Acidimicrobiales bacterium]
MTDGDAAPVHLEFLVEPFAAGRPGPHVAAGLDAVSSHGLSVDFGAFANETSGDVDAVAAAVADLLRSSFAAGASRVSVVVHRDVAP